MESQRSERVKMAWDVRDCLYERDTRRPLTVRELEAVAAWRRAEAEGDPSLLREVDAWEACPPMPRWVRRR